MFRIIFTKFSLPSFWRQTLLRNWRMKIRTNRNLDECYASFMFLRIKLLSMNVMKMKYHVFWVKSDHTITWPAELTQLFVLISIRYNSIYIIQWSRWCKCVFRPVVKPDRGSVTRKSAVQNVVKCGKNFPSSQLWIHSIIWFISRLFKNLSPQDCNTRYP